MLRRMVASAQTQPCSCCGLARPSYSAPPSGAARLAQDNHALGKAPSILCTALGRPGLPPEVTPQTYAALSGHALLFPLCPPLSLLSYSTLYSQFCEISTSLLSLQKQQQTSRNLFQRGLDYGKFGSAKFCFGAFGFLR